MGLISDLFKGFFGGLGLLFVLYLFVVAPAATGLILLLVVGVDFAIGWMQSGAAANVSEKLRQKPPGTTGSSLAVYSAAKEGLHYASLAQRAGSFGEELHRSKDSWGESVMYRWSDPSGRTVEIHCLNGKVSSAWLYRP